jgi:prepilin-type processing-associated H-X9-DG protein
MSKRRIWERSLNRILPISMVAAASILFLCGSALAHHGNSAYDEEHWITLSGNVTEFVWSNPHCEIFVDVRDTAGKVVNWSIESQSPGILRRNNWTRTTLKAGDQISITLAPAKNGAPVGFSGNKEGKVVFADGHVMKMDVR